MKYCCFSKLLAYIIIIFLMDGEDLLNSAQKAQDLSGDYWLIWPILHSWKQCSWSSVVLNIICLAPYGARVHAWESHKEAKYLPYTLATILSLQSFQQWVLNICQLNWIKMGIEFLSILSLSLPEAAFCC